jgi:xanthine dehydrogenase YagT iron-sulfur-binding subunit
VSVTIIRSYFPRMSYVLGVTMSPSDYPEGQAPGASPASSGEPTARDDVAQVSQGGSADRSVTIRLKINGDISAVTIDPRASLLDVLREHLGLTGTKKGCDQGACGACTVLLNDRRIVSCLTLAAMHDGAAITTIEGLAKDGELHPLQAAFIEHEGFQCGYCTAGQIMSGVACIAERHAGSPEEIRFWMSGNICRCGAYPGIVRAVADAASQG